VINGKSASVAVAVAAGSSAETVASSINAVAGQTGVEAEAKTQAYLYSEYATNQAYTVKVNGTATGSFNISSSNVQGGVDAINAISSNTGVTAVADGSKILISNASGADITVENAATTSGLNTLRMQTVGFDGSVTDSIGRNTKLTDTAHLTASTNYEISNATTGATTSFTTTSNNSAAGIETTINAALGATTGSAATRISTSDATSIATGKYYLQNNATSTVYEITLATATAAGWDTAIQTATIYNVGDQLHGVTVDLQDELDFTLADSTKLFVRGSNLFGDFDIYSDASLQTNIMNTGHSTLHTVGVKGTGVEVVMANGTSNADTDDIMQSIKLAVGTLTLNGGNVAKNGAGAGDAGGGNTGDTQQIAQRVHFDFTQDATTANTYTGAFVTVTGTDQNGVVIAESLALVSDSQDLTTTLKFATVTDITTVDNASNHLAGTDAGDRVVIGFEGTSATYVLRGASALGDFTIKESGGGARGTVTQNTAGDSNINDTALGLGGSSSDMGTVQGTIELSADDPFSVTQQGTENGNTSNDNYFTTSNSSIDAVSTLDLSTQTGAINDLRTLDGAMDKL
jgi:hypothetical protein